MLNTAAVHNPSTIHTKNKSIFGKLFGKHILAKVDNICEENCKFNYEKALNRLRKYCHDDIEANSLLNRIISILQNSRLTLNFNASQFDFVRLLKKQEIVNCYAMCGRPGDPSGYNCGRDSIETTAFRLNELDHSQYASYGLTGGFTGNLHKNRDFSASSRPIYAALDFLEGQYGGAPHYGHSFFILNDYVKHNCTFSPFDIYGHRFSSDHTQLCSFFHFENFIANCQNDRIGYNCLKSLIKKANGSIVNPHKNYGTGAEGNYIEAHIHGGVRVPHDLKKIYLSRREVTTYYRINEVQELAIQLNQALKRDFLILF